MATGGDLNLTDPQVKRRKLDRDLTDSQIEGLAREMEARKMESIAIEDLEIGIETVNNLKLIRQGDYMGFIRDLLVLWRNKNPGINQVQRLADILYSAAEEGGLVDPNKIQQILKVPNPKNPATAAATATTAEETVTEDEFFDIAEKLKPHVEKRMKIEPFPWLRDYYVDMRKLYTELTLEEISYTLLGEEVEKLQGYEEIFKKDIHSGCRTKVLMEGKSGMGKTTFGKRICWDWATGRYKDFSVVFFVFMKFVKPGEPIEDVIIKQNPELQGLGISFKKLCSMLERFGHRCLLILDGLDEHGLGQNEDVLEIIRNQKLLHCGIIVSSRPHITSEVKIYFSTVIRVDGFNMNEAERFVSNFFTDENQIIQVMIFRPSDSGEEFIIQKCPLLLSVLCFLVKEQDIDLSNPMISMGDICFGLVKCLYKKFTIRKNIKFEVTGFNAAMKSAGMLALRTLLSKNPLLLKATVFSIVGSSAFEYGLFTGHEDFRLSSDPTADIYITYVHRSVEEFLGCWGFIQDLNDGKSIDDILGFDCEEPIFLINPQVFHFCLWFLSSQDFDFPERDECYEKLTSYVAKHIDSKVFNPDETRGIYPAIDMVSLSNRSKNKFFGGVLNRCKNITGLHVRGYSQTGGIFELMDKDILSKLTTIYLGHNRLEMKGDNNCSLGLSVDSNCKDWLPTVKLLLDKYEQSQSSPLIHAKIVTSLVDESDIIHVLSKHVQDLHIKCNELEFVASGEFPHCPILTHLTIEGHLIDYSLIWFLRRAIQNGKLPCLRQIDFGVCRQDTFWFDWPNEVEVSVNRNVRCDRNCRKKHTKK